MSPTAPLQGWKQLTWVLALSAAAIEAHELGHRTVFWLTGTPARMGFQRVDATVPVSEALRLWGNSAVPW